jgi:hypothetical protein
MSHKHVRFANIEQRKTRKRHWWSLSHIQSPSSFYHFSGLDIDSCIVSMPPFSEVTTGAPYRVIMEQALMGAAIAFFNRLRRSSWSSPFASLSRALAKQTVPNKRDTRKGFMD